MEAAGGPVAGQLVPRPKLDARVRNLGGTLVVGWADRSVELDDVTALIWRAADGRHTIADIGKLVADEYDVGLAEAISDATSVLTQLHEMELIEFLDPRPAGQAGD